MNESSHPSPLASISTKYWPAFKEESARIAKEIGMERHPDTSIVDTFNTFRRSNPTLKDFLRNLDVATYDNRFQLRWNTRMLSAYARQQANKKYHSDVKPRLNQLNKTVSDNLIWWRSTPKADTMEQ